MNRDFSDLLAEFCAHDVEFLVVGAHALAAHGYVRATKDLDVWVRANAVNAARVMTALRAFGAPLQNLREDDLTRPGVVFQIGVPPVRIDILTAIDGVAFDEAWPARKRVEYSGRIVNVISRQHLVANKRAAGRTQDLADVERLLGDEDSETA